MGWQDAPIASAPSAPAWMSAPMAGDEQGDPDPTQVGRTPDMAAGNKTFSQLVSQHLMKAWQTIESQSALGKVGGALRVGAGLGGQLAGGKPDAFASGGNPVETAKMETALNATTGLLFGFPTQLGASVGALFNKYALGSDVDPKETVDAISKYATYLPQSELGKRLTGNVNLPLTKLAEGSETAGHAVTDFGMRQGLPDSVSAGAGALTEQTLQMLPFILLGELHRKMGGQTVGPEDMQNVAKVVAGKEAAPATVAAVENSLHAVYDKTGIGPYTIAELANKDSAVHADLVDPNVEVPKALEQFVKNPAEPSAPVPGDGAPLLNVKGDGAWMEDLRARQEAAAQKYSRMTYDELDQAHEAAVEHNKAVEVEAARKYLGDEKAAEFETLKTVRARDRWLNKNATDEMQDQLNVEQLPEETIREYRQAVNDFDTDSPEALGRSISIISRHVDESGFMQSPEGLTFRNAIRYADSQGWDMDAVLPGMRARAIEWAGEDASELMPRLFKEVIAKAKLTDAPETRKQLGLVAKAAGIDEAAVRAAAELHADDEPAFNAAIQEIIDGDKEANPSASAGDGGPIAGGQDASGANPADTGATGGGPGATLHAGIDPAAILSGVRDSYTPFVGVESPNIKPPKPLNAAGEPRGGLVDSLQKIFAPASRGPLAEQQAGIMRANFGEMARQREVALEKMKGIAAKFDKLPVEDNIKFIDAMERGTPVSDSAMAKAAESLRALLDEKRDDVQALGKGQLENFDENYFPHMWKDPQAAQSMFARRPLAGSGAFLKERIIPYTTDGLRWRAYDAEGDFVKSFDTEAEAKSAAGTEGRVGKPLKPITTNPVELALLKAREMDKYVYGQNIFNEMKDSDLARFVSFGDRALPGWTKINDKIARVLQPNEGEGGGMILRGEYYAPDEAATLINNHLSPGLQGNGFYDAWRGVGNAMNALQLGLSLFHVGFTTMDSMISKVALGVKQISRGDVLEGAGNALQGLNPAQTFVNIYKGDRLLRAYLGKLDSPDLAPIVDAIQQAGGRVKMDDFYRNAQVNAFKQALRSGDSVGAGKAFLPTVLDRMSAPIFEELVPRQKLGVFFDMAKDWLENNPNANVASKRKGLGDLWDSVDNRMGQLVYDNVFWDRALKDGLMATVRSVGWNLGTFRELGGGMLDIKNIARDKGFSDRTAYVVALPAVAAIYGAVLGYAYTGKPPETLKDSFYPRTGRLRPDGSEDRVSLPTYMKDVYAYGEDATNFAKFGGDPTQTIKNKMHPLISTISQMLNNQDFFGGAIRNPAESAVHQIQDEAKYIATQMTPFSLRNYEQQAKMKGEEPSFLGYMTSPSMVGVTPAPGYITKSPEELESQHVSALHDPLMRKFKEQIKGGADIAKLMPEMVRAGMTHRDIKRIIQGSGDTPRPHRLKKFGTEPEEPEQPSTDN